MITRGGRVARGTPGRGGFGGHFTPIRRSKVHVLHFSDHAGKPACMVFRGRETCTLPPLYAIAIYFTHPEADPSAVDPEALFETIIRRTPLESGCFLRLELFFTRVWSRATSMTRMSIGTMVFSTSVRTRTGEVAISPFVVFYSTPSNRNGTRI
ncbi:hypothetical protein GGS24DRAFT_461359 [Hypoxylon argillaceum]|nr:hypothetical protein GGS24DRAFT_461359 [Hypoxylon argillaceum]